jgi:hypothetical protein
LVACVGFLTLGQIVSGPTVIAPSGGFAGRLESPRVAHVLRSSGAGLPSSVDALVLVAAPAAQTIAAIRSHDGLPSTT